MPLNIGTNVLALVEKDERTHILRAIKVWLSLSKVSKPRGILISLLD
jgi:hypothetical protein